MKTNRVSELRRATQRFVRRFGALASDTTPCGQPLPMGHAHALMILLARGELSQQELGEELCVDKSNVARLAVKMIEAGHVSQRPCERDGRSRRMALTAKGKRVALQVEAASHARFASLLQAVPADRRDDVVEAMQSLVDALESMVAPIERSAS